MYWEYDKGIQGWEYRLSYLTGSKEVAQSTEENGGSQVWGGGAERPPLKLVFYRCLVGFKEHEFQQRPEPHT